MKKLIIISVLIGSIGAISYFTYPLIHDRYFTKTVVTPVGTNPISSGTNPISSAPEPIQANPPVNENPSETTTPPAEGIIENSIGNSVEKNTGATTSNIKANITPVHCDNDCKAFANDLVLFAYCQEVCGISPIKTDANCDAKKDLEKDYCLKDLAITKTDSALCEGIIDDNIRKTCHNRIAEDLLEKVQSGNNSGL
ncbi:MAG: hypothetical protein WC823_05595 [Parcubacteria group bacterium]|jgi:hypothetical protein